MTFILLQFKSNHTPDAMGNCMAFQPQDQVLQRLAKTTQVSNTKPQIDHINSRLAFSLVHKGFFQ